MKKITTTFLMLAAFALQAQTPGYTSTSIYDDFATTVAYTETHPEDTLNPQGVYWWGKANTGANPNNVNDPKNSSACYLANKYAFTRTGNGKLDFTVSQGSECWEPFGISTKLDLSSNSQFEVSITNTSSAAIYFDILLVDETKKIVNANESGVNFSVASIAPNETKVFSGNFAGGKHKTWPGPVLSGGLDFSKIVEIDFTVVSADQPENNNWGPVAITDYTFTLNYFKLGSALSSSVEEKFNAKTISIYPNPAENGFVTFSQTLNNVNVYNNVGQVVYSAASANRFDVSDFSAGMYLISSNEGVSKLIVK